MEYTHHNTGTPTPPDALCAHNNFIADRDFANITHREMEDNNVYYDKYYMAIHH